MPINIGQCAFDSFNLDPDGNDDYFIIDGVGDCAVIVATNMDGTSGVVGHFCSRCYQKDNHQVDRWSGFKLAIEALGTDKQGIIASPWDHNTKVYTQICSQLFNATDDVIGRKGNSIINIRAYFYPDNFSSSDNRGILFSAVGNLRDWGASSASGCCIIM